MQFRTQSEDRIVYSTDASRIKGNAKGVALPSSYEELQKIVRDASRKRPFPLVIRGGGTSLVGGVVPEDAFVVDMSRLNNIVELNLEEKTITVQTGIVLNSLNTFLDAYGMEFPVLPSSHASCTIGGMISTNAKGIYMKGSTSDWLLGLKIMDGTGKIFDLQGEEAKQIAETEGCCCIILEAKLKVDYKAKETSSDIFVFDDAEAIVEKTVELKNDEDVIAIEYINSIVSKLARMQEKEFLLVKYKGKKGRLSKEEEEKFWKLRENMFSVLVSNDYVLIEDPFIEHGLKQFLNWLKEKKIPCFGHISSGILHPHFKKEQIQESRKRFALLKV